MKGQEVPKSVVQTISERLRSEVETKRARADREAAAELAAVEAKAQKEAADAEIVAAQQAVDEQTRIDAENAQLLLDKVDGLENISDPATRRAAMKATGVTLEALRRAVAGDGISDAAIDNIQLCWVNPENGVLMAPNPRAVSVVSALISIYKARLATDERAALAQRDAARKAFQEAELDRKMAEQDKQMADFAADKALEQKLEA
jgi:hypothetical protein